MVESLLYTKKKKKEEKETIELEENTRHCILFSKL
jgi:hypothetical protein